jgi:SAM-dependent methyltransferase
MTAQRLFKTVADETRLRLLSLLAYRELNVQELESVLQMAQSRISHHLKLMSEAGLLACRRDGLWSFYRIAEEGPGRRFLESVHYLLEKEARLQADRELAERVLQEGRRRTRRFFDALAGHWESLRSTILGELDLAAKIEALLPDCATATDLGCGNGALLGMLGRKARSVIGVDSSRRMLEEARRRAQAQGVAADLRIGELEHLPLRDGEADCAVINLVLHHLPVPLQALVETRRALTAAGTLVVADFRRHGVEQLRGRYGDRWLGFEPQELESWLAQAGFGVLQRREFPVRLGLTVLLYGCHSMRSMCSMGSMRSVRSVRSTGGGDAAQDSGTIISEGSNR